VRYRVTLWSAARAALIEHHGDGMRGRHLAPVGRHSEPTLAPYLNTVPVDHGEPVGDSAEVHPWDVVDRLLWRDAQEIMARHDADGAGHCTWCGRTWPCLPRRCAERADEAARQPWKDAWTARHDLRSTRVIRDWRIDLLPKGSPEGWQRATSNRGPF
jgi:hypothetical protein